MQLARTRVLLSPSALLRPTYDVWPDLCWESEEGRRRGRQEGGGGGGGGDGRRRSAATSFLPSLSPSSSSSSSSWPSGWIALASVSACARACLLPSLPTSPSFPFYRVSFSQSEPPPSFPPSLLSAGRRKGGRRAAGSSVVLCAMAVSVFSALFPSVHLSLARGNGSLPDSTSKLHLSSISLLLGQLMACIRHVHACIARGVAFETLA